MPNNCAVAECKNVGSPESNLAFHRFPKDKNIRKAWIVKCRRKDTFNSSTSKICSEHFVSADYERDLRNELLGLPTRKLLKVGSIPSVFPARGVDDPTPAISRAERLDKRNNHTIAKLIMESSIEDEQNELLLMPPQSDFSCQVEMSNDKLLEDVKRLKATISGLRTRIKNLRMRLKVQRKKPSQTKGNRTFSPAQIKKLKGQARVNWDTADIVKALSMRSVSLKAYETARNSWNLPLPAPSTLQEWVHRFQCAPGIQTDIINILGEHSSSFGKLSKICALFFDEISLDGRFELDNVNDQISSHSKAQVIMARGIVEDWKQPIYFDFDKPMTEDILKATIKKLEKAGIQVVSVSSDLGAENRSLWGILNISPDKSWFENPADTERKVFVFADMPHLLKLVRNHILDDRLMREDGSIIDKEVMQTLVDTDCGELKMCPKLKQSLLDMNGIERMRVRPAAQLLSRHTAMLAKMVFSDSMEIGNFIQVLNDGMDVFNSRCRENQKNPLLNAFGVNLEQQMMVLQKLKYAISTTRFYLKTNDKNGNKRLKTALLPCQKGYLVSIESLVQLFHYLKQNYGVEYLITSRLNQDCLESFFSRIRGFGGPNPNPTPSEFRYRFRLILLGGSVRAPKDVNSLNYCSSNYVSADLLDKNNKNVVVNAPNQFEPQSLNLSDEIKRNIASSPSTNELEYLAGYIAWRLKRKAPSLPAYGSPGGDIINVSQPTWIQMLSRGGLLTPNSTMKDAILKCNSVFESVIKHVQGLPNVHANLQAAIMFEFPEIRKEIVAEFIKVRIKIRIKHLNVNREQLMSSRKMKSVIQSYKASNLACP